MALTFPETTKDERALVVLNKFSNGTTNPYARIILRSSDDSVISIHNMSNPVYTSLDDGVAVFGPMTNDDALLTSSINKFDAVDRDGTVVFSGEVGVVGSGKDLEVQASSLLVLEGDPIEIALFSYIEPG